MQGCLLTWQPGAKCFVVLMWDHMQHFCRSSVKPDWPRFTKVRSNFRCSALRHLTCGSWQDWFFPRRRPGTFWKSCYFKVACTVCRIIHCFEKYWLVLVAKNHVRCFKKTRSFKMLEGKVLDVEKQRSYRCALEYGGWSFCLLSTNKTMFAWDKALWGDAQSSSEWISSDIGDVTTALT